MLALTAPLMLRLQHLPQLAGWDVRTNTEPVDRQLLPAADVRCTGADAQDSEAQAVTLEPVYTVRLIVRRAPEAAEQLDAALAAVVGALHNWRPGRVGARQWRRIALRVAREAEFIDNGQAGYELVFTSSTVLHGATTG